MEDCILPGKSTGKGQKVKETLSSPFFFLLGSGPFTTDNDDNTLNKIVSGTLDEDWKWGRMNHGCGTNRD
jgi:hypothetical protein